MLSGRLWRRKTVEEDGFEVVANDSGVKLVEPKFQASLMEFLEMVKRETKAELKQLMFLFLFLV